MSRPSAKEDRNATPSSLFISMGLEMSWRLSLGVLVPIIGGVFIDKAFQTSPYFLIAGFVLAIVGTVMVIRRTVRAANEHPVFMSPETKAKIEDEDDD